MLTKRDIEVFNGIKEYIEKEGVSPSVRDICTIANVSSSSTAYRYVERLRAEGLIESKSKCPRTIRIVKEDNA